MDEIPMDFDEVLALLRTQCQNAFEIDKYSSERGSILLRSDITRPAEATLFVEAFERITHSRFRLLHSRSGVSKIYFRKDWVCVQNLLNKGPEKCAAKIIIAVTREDVVIDYDDYIQIDPLKALIRIKLNHNHTLSVLPYRRIPREVQERYFQYFRQGIKGVQAKRLVEEDLRKENVRGLNDSASNVRISSVYRLHKKWKQLKENVGINVPVSSSGYEEQSLFYNSSNPVINNNVSEFETEYVVEVEGLNHEDDSVDRPSFIIEERMVNDNNEKDYQLPRIVSCRSLAPGADHTAVPYPEQNVFPPSPKSPVILAANKPVPAIADNIVPVQNNNVASTSACVSLVRVEPVSSTQMVVYDASTNTYKVVKYLKVCSSTSASIHASNQYSSYFPSQIELPTRVGIQKL